MKTVLTKFLAISSIALLMLASCKKEGTKVIATNGTSGALQASATTIVLSKADVANTAVTFNLTSANFGYKAAVSNVLQIDVNGDNFAAPKEFTLSPGVLSQSFGVVDFNNLLLKLNLPTGVASQVQARIKSSVSATTAPVYSNVLALTVTPFALVSYVYVPGAYQGWNPASADSLQSPTGNGIYTGVINYAGADQNFKVTPVKNWNTAYGDAGGGKVSTSGGNLVAPAAGNVQVNLDLNANTIVMTPLQWSVIGDATPGGWGSDTDMHFNNGTQTWSVTVTLIGGKAIKFRKNHDWGTNYGSVTTAGVLDQANNNNISIAADGTYIVTIDLNALTYTAVKQ